MARVAICRAVPLCSLLGCLGLACNAATDAGSSDGGPFARDGGGDSGGDAGSLDSAPDGAGANPPVLDGGCTVTAPNSEGTCIVDQDCLGFSGTQAGTLRCTNGSCPPFCTKLPIPFPTGTQAPVDGGFSCARLSGPLAEDASAIGPVEWCVPGQVCAPYDGQWGCCTDTGNNSFMCIFALYGDGGAD
jgi:hypothetical protein